MSNCRNCGAPSSDDLPTPDHCGECPPWRCEDCGEMDSAAEHCACWESFADMAFADIKATFAEMGLSLG